jgi:hypothetical protein
MCRGFALGLLAFGCMIVGGDFLTAKALAMRMPSLPEKVAASDTIVTGKVVAFEEKLVEVEIAPGQKASYKVASIKIDDAITGAKGLTHVRVGFIPAPPINPNEPVRPIRPGLRGGFNASVEVGQEGCFFLAKFAPGDFLIVPQFCQFIDKKADGFEKQVTLVRKTIAVLNDPLKALKAKDQSGRFEAAAMLLQKYNAYPAKRGGKVSRQPVGAEESKLILTALMEADWSKNDDAVLSPLATFQRLGLQPKDGFQYPRVQPGQDFNAVMAETAKKWLKESAGTYRIQHWAEEKK